MIGLLLALITGEARATPISVGVSPAAQLHTGPRALSVGVGPAATAQVGVSAGWSARLHVGVYSYGPAFFQANLGAVYTTRPSALWQPAFGAELATTWGGILQINTDTERWRPSTAPLLAPRVVLQPLNFYRSPWSISVLNVSVGTGLESFGQSLSLGVEVLSVQHHFQTQD